MYILMFDGEIADLPAAVASAAPTLEEAFARICCHCGLSYRFVPIAASFECIVQGPQVELQLLPVHRFRHTVRTHRCIVADACE